MKTTLHPLNEQVVVITGASSGIGLATAHKAAESGASLVLAARSKTTLERIASELPTRALAVHCDVSKRDEVERVAHRAHDEFGRIDTWINNAGVSIYGMLEDVSEEDNRRLFDVNFWGIYHGSLIALPYLKERGGALINVGSEVSDAVIPLQGIYSASKHAVKGFTDALRIEVEEIAKAPVSITLIQPTAVNTPYPVHARNYMQKDAALPTPQVDPEDVADAILDAATSPTRVKKVGVMSKINTNLAQLFPSLADKFSAKQFERQQKDSFSGDRSGALYQPSAATKSVGEVYGQDSH